MTKYREYLKSKYWISRRIKFKNKTWNRCFICRDENNLEVHHKRYIREGKSILFHEKHTDLRLLCRRCHEFIHKNGWVELFAEGKIRRRKLRDLILGGVHN